MRFAYADPPVLLLLGVSAEDSVHDVFPGTGGMGRAVERFRSRDTFSLFEEGRT